MITVCAWCRKIQKVDDSVHSSDNKISHGLCVDCAEQMKKEEEKICL